MFRIHIHLIRIQHFRLNTDPDPVFSDDQKLKKIHSWKQFYIFFFIRNCNLPTSRPPSYREAFSIQNMKFLKKFLFCWSFLPAWIRIRIPNPDMDSLTWLNSVQSRSVSGSETLIIGHCEFLVEVMLSKDPEIYKKRFITFAINIRSGLGFTQMKEIPIRIQISTYLTREKITFLSS